MIENLRKIINDDLSVTILWKEPASKGGPDLNYLIQVNTANGFIIRAKNYTIHQGSETQKYVVLVSQNNSSPTYI